MKLLYYPPTVLGVACRHRARLGFSRVQLNLHICCPFGEYELDMNIQSYSNRNSTLQQRTAWEVQNGPDEVFTKERHNCLKAKRVSRRNPSF